MKLSWRAGTFTPEGRCYYQTAASARGEFTVSKSLVGGEPRYLLWRGKEMVRGMMWVDSKSAKAHAQEIEDGKQGVRM